MQNQNLALLNSYEHAKDLSIDLAVTWLAKYKFKDWKVHRTDPMKKNQPVTDIEKTERAKEIVTRLVDHKLWHSHGRLIGRSMLNDVLRLEIDEYPDKEATGLIRAYNDLLADFIEQKGLIYYMHDTQTVRS